MMNDASLGMKSKQMFKLLNLWADSMCKINDSNHVNFRFSDKLHIGDGLTKSNNDKNTYSIVVGTYPLSASVFATNQIISDLDFTRIGVAMFHEYGHYNQNTSKETAKEILISNLSKHRNIKYYKKNWSCLPHEIDAEYAGVMSMWSYLENIYPNKADQIVFDYLAYKTKNVDYMLTDLDMGFQSKNQVMSLFEDAYEKSLTKRRELPLNFLRENDEIARLFTIECGVLRAEYQPFYKQLLTANTGCEMDIKMASLVSYLHPGLQKIYPGLKFEELNPSFVFGVSMPETLEEIQERIDIKSEQVIFSMDNEQENVEFTEAVNSISTNLSDYSL